MYVIELGEELGKIKAINVKLLHLLSFFFLVIHGAVIYYLITSAEDYIQIICSSIVFFDMTLIIFFCWKIAKTRAWVRKKYLIPNRPYQYLKDIALAIFCTCCTLSQMGRHTADYKVFRAWFCTNSGLPDHVHICYTPGHDSKVEPFIV